MMKRKTWLRIGIVAVAVIVLVVCLAPWPQRWKVEDTGVAVDGSSYTVSIDAWRLHYLFRQDGVTGTVSLRDADGKYVVDHAEFNGNPWYAIGPADDTLGNVNYTPLMFYSAQKDRYVPLTVWFSTENDDIWLNLCDVFGDGEQTDVFAPADDTDQANTIEKYFERYTMHE